MMVTSLTAVKKNLLIVYFEVNGGIDFEVNHKENSFAKIHGFDGK